MKRLVLRVALVLALALGAGFAAQAPAAAVRHSGPNWVWFGPASWTAGYGTYGITILGGNGATLDLGFSSTFCAGGTTWADSVRNYFARQRSQLRQRGWTFRTVGQIHRPRGFSELYRRQVLLADHNPGPNQRGQIILDYDFTQNVDGVNYCYQRSIAKYSFTRNWANLRTTLQNVQNSLAYSGPGAPEGEDPDA